MPCPISSLSSVLERRTFHNALAVGRKLSAPRAYHKHAPALQQVPLRYVERDEVTPKEAEKRQRAVERLDSAIDLNDLSATLEAHRDSNRASVIRTVASSHDLDDSVVRPSFLDTLPKKPSRTHQEANAKTLPSPRVSYAEPRHETPNAMTVSFKRLRTAQDMLSDRFGITASTPIEAEKRGGKTQQRKRNDQPIVKIEKIEKIHAEKAKMGLIDSRNGQPNEEMRRAFLRRNERPLGDLSEARNTRAVYFDSIRRTRRLILLKQSSFKTTGRLRGVPDNILEYTGQNIRVKKSTMDPTILEPWAPRPSGDTWSRKQWFEQQIHLFAKWMEPTPAEEAARASVYQKIQNLVDEVDPTIQTEKFGSQSTGLAVPMSDIDIRIFPKDFDLRLRRNLEFNSPRAKAFMSSMNEIHRAVRAHPEFTLVVMHHLRYPLLGATHLPTGLSVQLVASPDTSPSRDKIREYLAEWPTLKPLYLVIKTIFDMRKLSDVWLGGLGSYSIFMMVAASLKHNNQPSDPISKQLLDFLKFFGELDTYTHGVTVEPPSLFKKKSYPSVAALEAAKDNNILHGKNHIQVPFFYQQYLLCLQDPANSFNDVGKKGFAIKDVQATLRALHEDVQSGLAEDGYSRRPQRPEPMLRKLIGRCDQIYEDSRTKLDLFGEDVLNNEGDK